MFNLFKKRAAEIIVSSPCKGRVVALGKVNDPTFAQEMIGKGAAVMPDDDTVRAPLSGSVTMVFPTGHAAGMTSDDGAEVLIHIGLDTVNLKGDGFTPLVGQGDHVKRGDPLIKVDFNKIRAAGYDPVIPVIITNTPSYSSIKVAGEGNINAGDDLITLQK